MANYVLPIVTVVFSHARFLFKKQKSKRKFFAKSHPCQKGSKDPPKSEAILKQLYFATILNYSITQL